MGSLRHFSFSEEFVRRYPIFVETGYGDGNGLSYAAEHGFERLYSLEVWPAAVERGWERFRDDPRVAVRNIDSAWGIDGLPHRRGVFFWLDAHFPGADADGQPYDGETDERIRLPLEREIQMIRRCCPHGDYFILVDDLRLYADLPWEEGPTGEAWGAYAPAVRGLDFLWPFTLTHDVQISLNDGGYALIGGRGEPRARFTG